MDIRSAIGQLTQRQSLSLGDMETVMRSVMTGECTPAQIAGLQCRLRGRRQCHWIGDRQH